MKNGVIPEVPIHIDSPMAVNATKIYSRYLNRKHIDPQVFEDGRLELFPRHVEFHRSVADSKRLNKMHGPRIIVSSSGMLAGGRVLHHLARLAPDPQNLVVLVGYQALGTRGRRMLDGERTIKIHGRRIPVRSDVITVHGLSGHADRNELLRWVKSAPNAPKYTFVVHGEEGSAEAFADLLERRTGTHAITPSHGEEFDLEALLDDEDD